MSNRQEKKLEKAMYISRILVDCIMLDIIMQFIFMTSISLCKVDIKATLIFNKLSMLLLVSTLHNNIND